MLQKNPNAARERRRRLSSAALLAAAVSSLFAWMSRGDRSLLGNGAGVGDRRNRRRRRLSSAGLRQFRDPQKVALRRHVPIKAHGFEGAYREYFEGAPRRDPGAANDNPRVAFLSSEGAACGYRECADPASGEFENEMGESREPPSDRELPPIESYGDSCVRGRAWHSFDPVNCNLFHEVDAGLARDREDVGISYLAQGGRRDTWRLDRAPSRPLRRPERIILKTLRWDQPYDERFFDNQRRDALALERLQDSPHVVDVYGFCGMATLNEFAGNGNLYKYLMEHNDISSRDLLVLARNVSLGLADVHEIDVDHPDDPAGDVSPMPLGMPTLLHYDFRHHNMLMTDDNQVKVSDFNIAQLLRWDTSKKETCGYWWYNVCGKTIWGTDRAPEECVDKDSRTQSLTGKTEVFHLGNILDFILSKRKFPFISSFGKDYFVVEGNDKKYDMYNASHIVKELILKGDHPTLPPEVVNSNDPAIKALVQARAKALTYDAKKRPSARDIANILDKAWRNGATAGE